MHLFAQRAHASAMAIAQKNASELVPRKAELGTDFVVAEECNRYPECDDYRGGDGDHVLVIEYRREDFIKGCTAYPGLSIVVSRSRPGAGRRCGLRVRRLLTSGSWRPQKPAAISANAELPAVARRGLR